jgi:anaerobic magnesium-protoporphyrin IX monomethyl ester cyclase
VTLKRIMLVRPRSRCGWGFMWAPLAINLEYIAANILDICEVEIVNQEFDETPIEDHLKDFTPDLFGVTMSATDHTSGLDLCKRAKKKVPGVKTIVGGFHPTAVPQLMLAEDYIDMVAVGESEMTVRELVQKESPVGVESIIYKDGSGKTITNPRRPVIPDLDTLNFPARHLRAGNECQYSLTRYGLHRDQIHTSRGCWGRCTFCCEPNMSASHQRYRKPEKVFEELKVIYELHHREPTFILLGDPHFMGRPEETERLCDMLIDAKMSILFTAMVRADMISKHPKVVEKMVKAGVIGYCLGLESPGENDLDATKKGISNEAQKEAVRLLRRNHAIAGGTFVGGLPGQVEEQVLMFPEYARSLGMLNAAFPVATPHAATEFYKGLDAKGLIEDREWENYDQMHLVFKHEVLTKQRCEELLTHCMGRFYAPDIFVDDIIAEQFRERSGHKMTVYGAIKHFLDRVNFVLSASKEYKTIEEGTKMGRIFLKAQVNPHTRIRTEKIGVHNVIDLKQFLSVAGSQLVRATLRQGGEPFVNYVLKSDGKKVEYVDVCTKMPPGATIAFTLDLEDVKMLKDDRGRFIAKMLKRFITESSIRAIIRVILAGMAEKLHYGNTKQSVDKIVLPQDFFVDFCRSDDWSEEKYKAICAAKQKAQ